MEPVVKKVIKLFALIFVFVLGIFLTYGYFKAPQYKISREMKISAKPEEIFGYINNSKKMMLWMPWQELSPDLKMDYSGPEEGVGSRSDWISKGPMGTGYSLITQSNENRSVISELKYIEPFEMSQTAELSLSETESGTIVKWQAEGENNFLGRLFSIVVNVDKMVGKDFEKGLLNLKNLTDGKL
jgi:hypothetical protein